MHNIFITTVRFYKSEGFIKTVFQILSKTFGYPFRKILRANFEKNNIFSKKSTEEKFTKIYEKNYWGSTESVSGTGSALKSTENLRNKLPNFFNKFAVKTVFDAPCGDFNWMQYVLKESEIDYVGGDIVLPLIEDNNIRYANEKTKFIHFDLTKDKFPLSDLMICRDCIFHLSYADTQSFLRNFVDSKIPYLLTTTYINHGNFHNKDIETGYFRLIDLFAAPYRFPRDVLFKIDDWLAPEPERAMCLWSREQILLSLAMIEK